MALASIDCSIYFAQHTERLVRNYYFPSSLVHHIVNIMANSSCQLKRILKNEAYKLIIIYHLFQKDNETIFP